MSAQREHVAVTRPVRNNVPDITVFFWIAKIVCATVASTAARLAERAFGIGGTVAIFGAALVVTLALQLRLRRPEPAAYWLGVVLAAVVGMLTTRVLVDAGLSPSLVTMLFAVLLSLVFAAGTMREDATPVDDALYWLAITVTFALGAAADSWVLELTHWTPWLAVLLPAALLSGVLFFWQLGVRAVLSFWSAFVLTQPLGANLGDLLAEPGARGGLGMGSALTAGVFALVLLTIVAFTPRRR